MDRTLKERLIGAAVLVALGIWLIPWILDGPPIDGETRDGEATAALELPVPALGSGAPLRRETIELETPAKTEPAEAPPAEAEPRPPAQAARDVADSEPSTAPVVAATETRTAPAAAPPPAPAPARAAAPASTSSGWMVQLGSFGDEANARRQSERIKTFGHDARIYPFAAGGRTMYRVRVGSFATRAQAEATASSLSAHGFPAQIVAPE